MNYKHIKTNYTQQNLNLLCIVRVSDVVHCLLNSQEMQTNNIYQYSGLF